MPKKKKGLVEEPEIFTGVFKDNSEEEHIAYNPVQFEPSVFGVPKIKASEMKPVPNCEPLPQSHVMGVVVGAAGEGKSFVLLSMIPLFQNLSQLIVCSRIIGNGVYDSVRDYCHATNRKYAFCCDVDNAKSTIEKFVEEKPDNTWCLIIFDDFLEGSMSRDNKYNKFQIQCYQMLRNYSCHMITLAQSYTGIPTLARNNINVLITFRMTNKHSVHSAAADFESLTGQSKESYMALYKRVIEKQHSYIMCCGRRVFLIQDNKKEECSFDDASASEQEAPNPELDQIIQNTQSGDDKAFMMLKRYIKFLSEKNECSTRQVIKMINKKYGTKFEY